MKAQELREAYVEFFKERGHAYIRSASLVPENDPTVLFTTAGMHPLVPYLLGQKHPEGNRLVNYQKCIRTGDIEEVGNAGHLTFFEMLGNWSLGDYFKKESITYSYEFLTEVLKLTHDQLAVTAFEGLGDIPKDEETAEIWKGLGIPEDRIFFYGLKENWWGPAGITGPCGPDTEIFFDDGRPQCCSDCGPSCDCGKYTEIWNNVFMEYFKDAEGKFVPLENKNVDTGMGLERVLRIMNNKETVFETELFTGIISKIEEISGKDYSEEPRMFRIIADHVRAATFIMGDGVLPARMGQGYILRMLIRRASRYLSNLGVDDVVMANICDVVIADYKNSYPELEINRELILTNMEAEERRFHTTLKKGLGRFDEMIAECKEGDVLDGAQVFRLFDTFGFPIELTKELAEEHGFVVDTGDFDRRFKEHQEASRAGADKNFKGGLADDSVETTKLHTATHLLNTALRKIVDPSITQRGSNITAKRLRFDFNLGRKVTPEEIAEIEEYINGIIEKDLPIVCEEMTYEEAQEREAIGIFQDKYGEKVLVYSIGDESCEICGGPHVESTGELEGFKIKKEESSAAGVRRIRAVVGKQ